ncbi:MAG: hypothetical protein IJE60_05690 [Tyzzerella sp.]|nr:hypothetical protein [Tyzzerella sp.]
MKMNEHHKACEQRKQPKLYKIGMFANMNRVTIKTLRFHKSYAVVLNYIEENGYEICGNIRESYIDGVWNKDSTEEWLSEIQIPIRRKG